MSDKKTLFPLEALDARHEKENADRAAKIDAAMKDVRAAQTMLDEARRKVASLQQENTNASFAYDAERARLLETDSKSAKAAA